MSDIEETQCIYNRDQFDLTLGRAARLLLYADYAEAILLQEGYSQEDLPPAHITPEEFIRFRSDWITSVLGILRFEAYRDGELNNPELLSLLSRIGAPELCVSVDASGNREVEYWPEPDRKATREDLLYSYLLAKLVYLELKAKLRERSVTQEELALLKDAASSLVPFSYATINSVDEAKLQLIHSWRECNCDPSDAIRTNRQTLLKLCWSSVATLFRVGRRR